MLVSQPALLTVLYDDLMRDETACGKGCSF
jgi:hypothetical protein